MKNNTWTIIKKEFARFFGDRQLLFTSVIMPGLLIYIIYSLMGSGIRKMESQGVDDLVIVRVENLSENMAPLVREIPSVEVLEQPVSKEDVEILENKDLNMVL
nr:hypothetical protein [Bacteroidales bacterium]